SPWGEKSTLSCSYLEFDQKVLHRRQDGEPRQLAFDHGDFVAAVVTRADTTVLIDLVWEFLALRDVKTQFGEKLGTTSEQANAADLVLARLRHERLHEKLATSTLLIILINCDGADFRQMRTIKVERTAADDFAGFFEHSEIPHVLADLSKRTRQKRAVGRIL